MTAFLRAPLCPAGHLPHKGGDQPSSWLRPFCIVADWRNQSGRLISPLVGEMSGRTEGGNVEHRNPKPFPTLSAGWNSITMPCGEKTLTPFLKRVGKERRLISWT